MAKAVPVGSHREHSQAALAALQLTQRAALQEHWGAGRRACSALTALLDRLPADTATTVLAGLLCPAMPRRLSARAALALPFLQRMAAAPRELRRAPSGELRAVLSIHSVDSGASADENPARNLCAPISEGGASAGSSDRVDADSAMGSQLGRVGARVGVRQRRGPRDGRGRRREGAPEPRERRDRAGIWTRLQGAAGA